MPSSGAPSTGATTAIRLFSDATAPIVRPWSLASAALETMLWIAAVRAAADERADDDHREHHPAVRGQPEAEIGQAPTTQPDRGHAPRPRSA